MSTLKEAIWKMVEATKTIIDAKSSGNQTVKRAYKDNFDTYIETWTTLANNLDSRPKKIEFEGELREQIMTAGLLIGLEKELKLSYNEGSACITIQNVPWLHFYKTEVNSFLYYEDLIETLEYNRETFNQHHTNWRSLLNK